MPTGRRSADQWRLAYLRLAGEVREGRREHLPFPGILREALLEQFVRLGVQGATAADVDELVGRWRRLPPWPDVAPGLAALRRHVVLASLSNADIDTSVAIDRFAGLGFDLFLGAEPAGTYKPAPAVYLQAARVLGLPPGQIMMVAAHNRDLEAAADLGFRTGFVRRPTEFGPGQATDLTPTRRWDVLADGIPDLLAQLGPGHDQGPDPTSPAGQGRRLPRAWILTVAAVVATSSALAFGQGYRAGVDRPPPAAPDGAPPADAVGIDGAEAQPTG